MSYPVSLIDDGIKLQPEKMEIEKLYHCIYEDIVYLFYKDSDELLHCYEINDKQIVDEIGANPSNLEEILKKRINLNL